MKEILNQKMDYQVCRSSPFVDAVDDGNNFFQIDLFWGREEFILKVFIKYALVEL